MVNFSDDPKKVLRRTKQWARYVRNNPDADVYLSDMVNHQMPDRGLFDMFSDVVGGNRQLSDRIYNYSNGDKIKLGYINDYLKSGNNTFSTKIVDVWFKGHIGGNRYDIGFIGNSVNGGNPPTLFYLNIYGKSLWRASVTRVYLKNCIFKYLNPTCVREI